MRHTFLVVTVKRWLKSVNIYGSYRKIKTGVPLFGPLCKYSAAAAAAATTTTTTTVGSVYILVYT